MIVNDVDALARALRSDSEGHVSFLVSVDGLLASGKSWLAKRLAEAIPARRIEVDRYVEKDRGQYVPFLLVDELAERVARERSAPGVILIEGVCISAVLRRLGITPHRRIYVKMVNAHNDWFDGETFADSPTSAQAIAREEGFAKAMGDTLSELRREVITYHCAFSPHTSAHYIFLNAGAEG